MGQPIKPKILGITGGSASGKSTFARRLQSLIGENQLGILSQDHYYLDQSEGEKNFDHPSALDLELLSEHLRLLDRGLNCEVPQYCFKTNRRLTQTEVFQYRPIVIIDGTLILTNLEIRERLDYCVFLDVPERIRYERRLKRDIQERARTETSVKHQFHSQVKPMHDIYVDPYQKFAQLIIQDDESLELALWQTAKMLKQSSMSAMTEALKASSQASAQSGLRKPSTSVMGAS